MMSRPLTANDNIFGNISLFLCLIGVLLPTQQLSGHMEKGPRFKVSSERLEKPGIEHTTPDLQGQ